MNTIILTIVLMAAASTSAKILDQGKPIDRSGNFELLILHNNDMHARFEQTSQLSGACSDTEASEGKCYGGFARVAHVVKEARSAAAEGRGPPVLYLNAGDTYTGTAWFTLYKWKIAAEFINALQPDAVCLGNHEFDEAVDGVIPFIRNVTSPVLAANLILDTVPELEKEPNLHKSIILTIDDIKIGVIGYLTPETKFLAPKNNVEYEDEVIAIRREVTKLKEEDVNIFIALGHSGFIKDLEIAKQVEDIDIVIGGHSNTFLWNSNTTEERPEFPQGSYPTIVTQASGRMVAVVQAYAYTKYMGRLHITFDSEGEILEYDGTPLLLNQKIPRDTELMKLISKYRSNVDIISKEVVGSSMVLLKGDDCRLRECNMGNVITDALLYYTKQHYNDRYPNVNIALTQGGRIRSSIERSEDPPFNLTRGDWITVLPFSDTLSILTMNGTTLMQTLEHSVDAWRIIDSPGQFLQVSGIQVVYDFAKPPGSRVVEAKAVCSNCYEPILSEVKENYEYKLIMSSFLANAGDGYKIFESLPKESLPYNEVTCVIGYLKQYSPINPIITGRVTILNEDKISKLNIDLLDVKNITRHGRLLASKSNAETIYLRSRVYYPIFVLLCSVRFRLW